MMTKRDHLACSLIALMAAGLPGIAQAQGFDITLNTETVVPDAAVAATVRRVDLQIANADVEIDYNPIDLLPELGLDLRKSGNTVTASSSSNYPEFITRGELRLYDTSGLGAPRLVQTIPLAPNQSAQFVSPQGDVVAVYRVYSARDRYDQTGPLPLGQDGRSRPEDNQHNIRLRGGTVTITGNNIASGGSLTALGETLGAGPDGTVRLERILPNGAHAVDVSVNDSSGQLSFGREIDVDSANWTYFVVADLEVWRKRDRTTMTTTNGNSARVQIFVDGETRGGIEVTASLDTGPGPIGEAFRRLGEKDPRSLAGRLGIDPERLTFGDGSTSVDLTPTSGRVYARVQQDENFALWGDYTAQITGSGYLRNERALYGAQLHFETAATTQAGNPRFALDLNAAQRDQLFGREVFLGTGGTVFFLSKQDITTNTTTVSIELRDATTGRVTDRIRLQEGVDYQINEFQGVIRLNGGLSGDASTGLIDTTPGPDQEQFLVVEYEYTPVGLEGDGMDLSGRAEVWASDSLRFGLTGLRQSNGTAVQEAIGVDLRYILGDNSFVQLDYARTEGPGFDVIRSSDAGLINDTTVSGGGTGEAYKLEFELDLGDVSQATGTLGGYAEFREQGFSTLDYEIDATTGDQRLFGAYFDTTLANGLSFKLQADHVDNANAADLTDASATLGYQINTSTLIEVALGHLQQDGGRRTDIAARLTYDITEHTAVYVFGQHALSRDGLDANDRIGVGGRTRFDNGWTVSGELSDGTTGQALAFRLENEAPDGSTRYIGWEVDPSRTFNTAMSGGRNSRLVFGGRQTINDRTEFYGENVYDVLGSRREITSLYGLEFAASEALSFGANIALGQVQDSAAGDLERLAFSLSATYQAEAISGRARLEYRVDDELSGSGRTDTQTLVFAGNLNVRIDDSQHLIFDATASRTEADTGSLLGGDYVDVSLSYAYRPVTDERMNILASYRYLRDDFGQELDGVTGEGPVQESHVLNVEGNYDLGPHWTVAGKLGLRFADTAEARGAPLASNDAWIAIANARYHVVQNWDVLVEARHFEAIDTGFSQSGALVAAYRHFGNNVKAGIGYNFTSFSDDLTDLTFDDEGVFLNVVTQF